MKRSFDDILLNLKKTIADYRYYVDFEKAYRNVNKYKIELNILNSLIGSKNIEKDFISIITEYPKTLRVIPILLAIRNSKVQIIDNRLIEFEFNKLNQTIEKYIEFMDKTGLFDLMENNKIKDLNDYLTGVEVGLDTHGRKNRTGDAMENIVENFIKKTQLQYGKEMNKKAVLEKYGIDLSHIKLDDDESKNADKRFDFVVRGEDHLYLIETNFYSSQGSKLNETARSYKSLTQQLLNNNQVKFVWITDGVGWKNAKNNLKETYEVLEDLYTLVDLENNILEKVFK